MKWARGSVLGPVLSILPVLFHTLFPLVLCGEHLFRYVAVEKTEAE